MGNIASTLTEEHAAAAASTVGLVPAAGDEVSAGVAQLFSRYAEGFQGLAGRAAAFPEPLAHTLTAGAHSYASAEAINVSYLRWLVENAGLYAATRALFEMLRINSIFFQLLQYVLEPIRFKADPPQSSSRIYPYHQNDRRRPSSVPRPLDPWLRLNQLVIVLEMDRIAERVDPVDPVARTEWRDSAIAITITIALVPANQSRGMSCRKVKLGGPR